MDPLAAILGGSIKAIPDIRKAAKVWTKDPGAMGFGSSTRYDVYVDGKPFPPKAISALAYKFATGETLGPHDFPGA